MKMACPNCGGNVIYILGSDKVTCEYCNEKISVEKINISEFTKYAQELKEQKEQESKGMRNYIKHLFEQNSSNSIPKVNQVVYKSTPKL